MAASNLGGSVLKYVYHSSSLYNKNPGQLFFFRGFASTLFVKGISFSTTEDVLANSFSQFGKVVEVKVMMDKVRNRSKGYGYVTFAEEDEARKALIVMNGQLLDGRVIFVDKVRPGSLPRTPSQAADE
ncbi:small RNA-binding protein 11, chloroplastic [Herrania umbratica]|uniref:Small RNA-binding protein 11, chloroplastic n=1 Tax=Herrania umbratica TaxID=108875 RepID=A0A6J0ZVJ7_9ROSI|nr:small RNA-binding protein 11, chloroplastic [Herrania umbratica]